MDLRHFGKDGEDTLDSELEESTDPEACFTPGDAANSLFTIITLLQLLQKSSVVSVENTMLFIVGPPKKTFETLVMLKNSEGKCTCCFICLCVTQSKDSNHF